MHHVAEGHSMTESDSDESGSMFNSFDICIESMKGTMFVRLEGERRLGNFVHNYCADLSRNEARKLNPNTCCTSLQSNGFEFASLRLDD